MARPFIITWVYRAPGQVSGAGVRVLGCAFLASLRPTHPQRPIFSTLLVSYFASNRARTTGVANLATSLRLPESVLTRANLVGLVGPPAGQWDAKSARFRVDELDGYRVQHRNAVIFRHNAVTFLSFTPSNKPLYIFMSKNATENAKIRHQNRIQKQ